MFLPGSKSWIRMTAGFQPSDLIIVAGRPSMGKTAFCLNIAQYAAIEKRIPVAIFSLEMSKEQLVIRMLCSEAQVEGTRLRTGFLTESDWPRLTLAAGNLSDAPIYIDDTRCPHRSRIASKGPPPQSGTWSGHDRHRLPPAHEREGKG